MPHALWRYHRLKLSNRDVDLSERRDGAAAKQFCRRSLTTAKAEPRHITSDKLASYNVAHRDLIPDKRRETARGANNRVERSQQKTRS